MDALVVIGKIRTSVHPHGGFTFDIDKAEVSQTFYGVYSLRHLYEKLKEQFDGPSGKEEQGRAKYGEAESREDIKGYYESTFGDGSFLGRRA